MISATKLANKTKSRKKNVVAESETKIDVTKCIWFRELYKIAQSNAPEMKRVAIHCQLKIVFHMGTVFHGLLALRELHRVFSWNQHEL